MKDFIKIESVRSDGERMAYETEEWGLLHVEGLDFSEAEIFKAPRGFGNGDLVTGKRKGSRDITIQAKLRNPNLYEATRQRVIGYHNSNFTYTLNITYMDTVRVAQQCVLTAANYKVTGRGTTPILSLTYTSPESDLFADNSHVTHLSTTLPMWHDTRVYAAGGGKLAFGELKTNTIKTIEYLGSEPAPVMVRIEFTGYDEEVKFRIGERTVDIPGTWSQNDVVLIDTGTRTARKIKPYDQAINVSPRDLYRLVLEYGNNEIEVISKNHSFRSSVEYVGRYNGI